MFPIRQQVEAAVKASQIEASGEEFDGPAKHQYTITTLAPLFIEWARYDARRAAGTLERYREALRSIVRDIGDVPVGELHYGHLLALRRSIEDRGCGVGRLAGILSSLRSFLRFCHEVLRLRVFDYKAMKIPRVPRRDVIFLTKEEVQRFIDAVMASDENIERVQTPRLRFRALIEVILGTGGRISEVLALNRGLIDYERREGKVIGKGNKERTLFFTDRAIYWMKEYLARRWDDHEAVFVTQGERPERLQRRAVIVQFTKYRQRSGILKAISPHILRHTMATTLLFNGCPIGHIKELLGHERLDTTCRYYLGVDKRAAKEAHQKYLTYEV